MAHSTIFENVRRNMTTQFTDLMRLISDSGNPLASKFITYFGVAGGVGGGTVQLVTNASTNDFIQECVNSTPDWLAYVPVIGVVSLIVKHVADIYFRRKELKILEGKALNANSGQT